MNEEITKAIQSARYGDSIQVSIADDEGNSQNITLVACLDEENGGVKWSNAACLGTNDESTIMEDNLRRHLQTKKWIFPMLNDHRRNELYDLAIERAAEEVSRRIEVNGGNSKGGIQCMDIGSGSGLLGLMAARSLKDKVKNVPIRVKSLEMSSAMAAIARETVTSNGLDDIISIEEGHSCEIPPLETKALLCTSELLESGLLGEGWIPAMRDAWARHLTPNAVVVPRAAKVYAQIVEGKGVTNFWGPHQKHGGYNNGRSLSLYLDADETKVLLDSNIEGGRGVQVPVHFQKLLNDTDNPIRVLSEPLEVLEIRVDSRENIPQECGGVRTTSFIPKATGRAHGVVFWWQLDLFNGVPKYDTRPGASQWQDHWHQCLYAFTTPPDECIHVKEGVPATLKVSHTDLSLAFSVFASNEEGHREEKRQRQTVSRSMLISPTRALQLNDGGITSMLRKGIKSLLEAKGTDAVVIDVSDFSLPAMVAAMLGANNVTSLEASSTTLPESTARIAQIANGLPLARDGHNETTFQIVRCHVEQLNTEILGGGPADMVLSEPYYEVLEERPLEAAFNHLFMLKGLRSRGLITSSAVQLPSTASIMACAFESKSIAGAYQRCNDRIRRFDHSAINKYHTSTEWDITVQSWQYDITPLSKPFSFGSLDYQTCSIKEITGQRINFNQDGTMHGLLLWVDYELLSSSNGSQLVHSMAGRPFYQTVRLLAKSVKACPTTDWIYVKSTLGRRNKYNSYCHTEVVFDPPEFPVQQ